MTSPPPLEESPQRGARRDGLGLWEGGYTVADPGGAGRAESVADVARRPVLDHTGHGSHIPGGDGTRAADRVRLLDADPDLGQGLDARSFVLARRLLCAPVVTLERGSARPPDCEPETTFGLLVLSGLVGRRVRVSGAHAIELLGPGDILRPWDEHELLQSVPPKVDWTVLQPARLAILDGDVTKLIGRRPELIIAFSGRLLDRARGGSYLRAVSHLSRVDEKLRITLWYLASRWGRVTPAGVVVPFRLTHEVLGEILGARRPSVTLALKRLRYDGIVERGSDGRLILLGAPAGWPGGEPAQVPNE